MPDLLQEFKDFQASEVRSAAFTTPGFLEDKAKLLLIKSADKLPDFSRRSLSGKTTFNMLKSNNKNMTMYASKPKLVTGDQLVSSDWLVYNFNNVPKGYYIFEINLKPTKNQEFSIVHYITTQSEPVNPQTIQPTKEGKVVFMINHQTNTAQILLLTQGTHLEYVYLNTEISKVD